MRKCGVLVQAGAWVLVQAGAWVQRGVPVRAGVCVNTLCASFPSLPSLPAAAPALTIASAALADEGGDRQEGGAAPRERPRPHDGPQARLLQPQ